jgi:hypothetical protein
MRTSEGGNKDYIREFKWRNLLVKDHLKDREGNSRVILKFMFGKEVENMNWMDLTQDRTQ